LFSSKTSLLISVIHLEANSSKSLRLITLYFVINLAFEKPFNLGILLNNGVCPPSNQSGTHPPDLQFCPFIPLPQKVPFQEPFHLHNLLDFFLDPVFDLMFFKVIILIFLFLKRSNCFYSCSSIINKVS